MRIVGGAARGRRLQGPAGSALRPTADRVRQALFDVLGQRLEGERVIDLYAGTGALGLEALSRGAASARLVDRAPKSLALCRGNSEALGFGPRVLIERLELPRELERLRQVPGFGPPFELAFVDPPYSAGGDLPAVLDWLAAGAIAPGGLALVEHDRRLELPKTAVGSRRLRQVDLRRFGDTAVTFFRAANE
ncbi:MAG: 16S rRNA (guanine(966)-N(2))-methyltransferase RsmD [Deltaproteobacteria bacterium]